MTANEMRKLYINYFIQKGHKEIASASLIPENDASVLFTTAGMHPLIPYLLGGNLPQGSHPQGNHPGGNHPQGSHPQGNHPQGKRLVNVQKCLRTDDIDEVGDDFHHTYFEMLGNWSLGDYFKEEAISMSFEFLTSVLNIPSDKLAVTVFDGYEEIPRDTEAYECWKNAGLNDNQIFYGGMKENWWGPIGKTGPCGPDTEIFYDTGKESCGDMCSPLCDCGRFVEIWNNVFMQYNKNIDGNFTPLNQKNVDTGMSLERILAVYNHLSDNYETELFSPIIERIEKSAGVPRSHENEVSYRIISDHLRAAVFVMGDDKKIAPSNTEQGYIVRRLIRRAVRHIRKIDGNENILDDVVNTIIDINSPIYPELLINRDFILEQIEKEYRTFISTIDKGTKKVEMFFGDIPEGGCMSGESAFKLYDTFGFPIEYTVELAAEKGFSVDIAGFNQKFAEHQEKSRSGADGKFKGGLADNTEQTTKLHTATHLLNGALRKILGDTVFQRGSNITPERLRFDFSFDRKLTSDEIKQTEDIVNDAIKLNIDVICEEMTVEEAKVQGAIGVFESKYGDKVKVYTIGDFSKEICGGPHASNTGELKLFKIIKEESSSSGVRRIKAVIG